MLKYSVYSLLVHSLVIAAALLNFHFSGNGNGDGQEKGEGDSQGNAQEQAKKSGGTDVDREIVEVSLVAAPGKKKEVPKDFFYGIGVSINFSSIGVYAVTDVYAGYPAQFSGMTTRDLIIALDGKPVGDFNDIASDKSRTIVLTINRDGLIFDITLVTEKIYFTH